ncbi:MAG: DUF4249 domain-containing protein [Bacteroidota bacterium]|nr:DUF4249 domain-containing protein [Bacteroidota bacterium]
MLRFFYPILFLTVCVLTTSCETEIKIDVDKLDSHLVLNSLFCPDSLIQVRVSETRDVFNEIEYGDPPLVDISIYENSEFVEKLISEGGNIYSTASLIPRSNSNYELVVESPWGQSNALSTVPTQVVPDSIWIERKVGRTEYDVVYHRLAIQFKDNDLEKNYYSIFLRFEYLDSLHGFGYLEGESTLFCNDPIVNQEIDYDKHSDMNRQIVFSDELINGQNHELRINFFNIYSSKDPHKFVICMHFNTISEEYYRYLKTLELYKRQRNSNIWEDVSEPVGIYSNISNGYGIFGGYCAHIDTLLSVE